jgi:hypothetical protein
MILQVGAASPAKTRQQGEERMHALSGKSLITAVLLVVIVLTGCSGGSKATAPAQPTKPVNPTQPPLAYTQSAATIAAELTRNAPPVATIAGQMQMLPSPTATDEPLPPTSTPLPTNTPLPSDTPEPTKTPFPTNTLAPTLSPTAPAPAEPNWVLSDSTDLLRKDRFQEEKSEDFYFHFAMGGYVMLNKTVKDIVYSVSQPAASNVRLEVTGQRVNGPIDGYYGLICDFSDGQNYYFLGVGVDGWYGIGVRKHNTMTWLKEGMDTLNVHTGPGVNQLRADCYNNQLNLWVNGNLLATVKDVTYSAGWIGLGVGNRANTGTEVVFKNLQLYLTAQP